MVSYGEDFGRVFGVQAAPAFVTTTLQKSEVAVTFVRQEVATFELTEKLPVQDVYLISLGLLNFPAYTLWENGKPLPVAPVTAPEITICDMRAQPVVHVNNPLVGLHFHLPRAAMDALADSSGVPRIGELDYPHGTGIDDRVMHHLGMALLPAFRAPDQANRLFVDHVTLAVAAHIAQTYGAMRNAVPKRGGLAPWQERLALEILDANIAGDLSHAWIARQCGLSPSHFARAFRVSMGRAPHQWLLHRRVERAKAALRNGTDSLAAIALSCGFADQSHFTRVFTRLAGLSPGEWRRRVRS